MRPELVCALLLELTPCWARPRRRLPTPAQALARMTSVPTQPCTARGRIQFFPPGGGKPKGLGTMIYALPDGRIRREIRDKGPRQPAAEIIIDDGRTLSLYLAKPGLLWSGEVPRESARTTRERLESLYAVSVSTGGRVAKRKTWRVDLRAPDGAARVTYWIDRDDGLLLKTETYRYDGSLMRRERLTRLDCPAQIPDGLLASSAPPSASARPLVPPDPPVPGSSARFPSWTPLGFLPLEARALAGGALMTYGDGAQRFTVLEAPADAASGLDESLGREVRLADGTSARLLPDGERNALVRRDGSRLLVVSGDLSDDELARVAESLTEAR